MRFRIRSESRDATTDIKRLQSIERPILKAIADAKAEKNGLESRMRRASNHAAVLMGNDVSEYLDREPEIEQLLADEEKTMMAALTRIRQLNQHLAHLHRILELLKTV